MKGKRILLTGAAGVIGSDLRRWLVDQRASLLSSDVRPFEPLGGNEEIVIGDLCDAGFASRLCEGVDAIIHMAGRAKEGQWTDLTGPNIMAATHLWDAAHTHGVERIVFGSSNHVVGFYRPDEKISNDDPQRPDSRYAITKAFGEHLASVYAYKFGLKAFCIRIGSYRPEPISRRELSTWISPRDLAALVEIGLNADYVFETVFGISANKRAWCDNARAHELGYQPRDDAEVFAARFADSPEEASMLENLFQGGGSAAKEFLANPALVPGR
ncbi:NAD(P)-dependent oxidoreductase [Corticibacterium sp. UT-5YL-CI-8]|nr:NAD(P)-dependent oxidoreductase [Tianweitania sp. UT-5YL-CI-8]